MVENKILSEFAVSDEEVRQMIDELLKDKRWDQNEVNNLPRAWIRAIMGRPFKKNKKERRPFDYSKNKLMDYLDWRKKSAITSKISHHLNSDGTEIASLTASIRPAFYWYGTDSDGAPILWYHADRFNFKGSIVKNDMEVSALVMQAGLDAMVASNHHVYDINFVILFDVFNPLEAMRKPTLAPAFVKLFMRIFPDRLKRGIFLTGTLGHVFYKIAKQIAPSNIMDKVSEVQSREEASKLLIHDKIVEEDKIPTFLGGTHDHNEEIVGHFPSMIKKISADMMSFTSSATTSY